MTDHTLYVVPATGRLVRDPLTRDQLPSIGKRVPRTPYWLRRLADKDVLEVPDPQEAKAADTGLPAKARGRAGETQGR